VISEYAIVDGVNLMDIGINGLKIVRTNTGMITSPYMSPTEIIEDTIPYSDSPIFFRTQRQPIEFTITISLVDDEFTTELMGEISRLFKKNRYVSFQTHDDLSKVYYVICTNQSDFISNGNGYGYITLNLRTNAPYAWSENTVDSFDCTQTNYLREYSFDGSNHIFKLDVNASTVPDVYENHNILIVEGSGVETNGYIYQYLWTTKEVYCLDSSPTQVSGTPDTTSRYFINRKFRTIGSNNVVNLGYYESSEDDFYNGYYILTLKDNKVRKIIDYVGLTRTAYVDEDWDEIPSLGDEYLLSTPISVYNNGTLDEYFYPEITFKMYGNDYFSIINDSNDGEEFTFEGINEDETIYVNNKRKQIISDVSSTTYRINEFNKNWFRLVYGKNDLHILGRAEVQIEGQYPLMI
jgi:hypothetical protein